jgi:hypothetical protein
MRRLLAKVIRYWGITESSFQEPRAKRKGSIGAQLPRQRFSSLKKVSSACGGRKLE